MSRLGWKWLAGLAVAGLAPLSASAAPPVQTTALVAEADAPASDKDRIAKLEAELKDLKAIMGGAGCGSAPSVNCQDDHCNKCSGFTGGAEVIFLAPHNSAGIAPLFDTLVDIANAFLPFNINEPDWDLQPSWRVYLGWESAGGLGVRTRFWEFNHTAQANTTIGEFIPVINVFLDSITLDYSLEARTLDFEVTDRFTVGKCNCLASLGYRYVHYRETNSLLATGEDKGGPIGTFPVLTTGFRSYSHGLTGGLEIVRPIGQTRINLIANGRASLLFGDEDEVLTLLGGVIDLTERERDNTKCIWEAQAGIEWVRNTQRGAQLFFRGVVEGQYWDHFSGVPIIGDNAAVGFIGVGLAAGIHR